MRTLTRWIATFVGAAAIGMPLAAWADVSFDPTNLLFTNSGLPNTPPALTAALLINQILGILGVIAIILIIYAGFLWMFSRGNEEKVGTAVKILRDAFIGLLIIIASYGIANYIFWIINNAT